MALEIKTDKAGCHYILYDYDKHRYAFREREIRKQPGTHEFRLETVGTGEGLIFVEFTRQEEAGAPLKDVIKNGLKQAWDEMQEIRTMIDSKFGLDEDMEAIFNHLMVQLGFSRGAIARGFYVIKPYQGNTGKASKGKPQGLNLAHYIFHNPKTSLDPETMRRYDEDPDVKRSREIDLCTLENLRNDRDEDISGRLSGNILPYQTYIMMDKVAGDGTLREIACYMHDNPNLEPMGTKGVYHYAQVVVLKDPLTPIYDPGLDVPNWISEKTKINAEYYACEQRGNWGILEYDTDQPLTVDENGRKLMKDLQSHFNHLGMISVGGMRLLSVGA